LSLQERSQLQRDKQLRFLREQGLIQDESDVKGGAGALDNVSVTSSNKSPSKLSSSQIPAMLLNRSLSPKKDSKSVQSRVSSV